MIPVVDAAWWNSVVNRSHNVNFRFELRDYTGSFIQYLYPASGSIDVSLQGGVTRSLQLRLYDDGTLMPSASNTKLSPFSDNEIWVYYTINDAGITDSVLVGIFRVGQLSLSYSDTAAVELTLSAYDRACVLTSYVYSKMYKIAASTPLIVGAATTVFSTLLSVVTDNRNLSLTTNVASGISAVTLTSLFGKYLGATGNSPWDDLSNVVQAVGAFAYVTPDGALSIKIVPNMDLVAATTTFAEGLNVLSASREYDQNNFCNAIKLDGVSTVLGTPLTVTYAPEPSDSPFAVSAIGTRAMAVQNEWVFSTGQASKAAEGLYQLVRGYDVELSVLPDPRLDILDMVQVTVSSLALNTVGLITGISLPLDAESSMRVTVRVRGY